MTVANLLVHRGIHHNQDSVLPVALSAVCARFGQEGLFARGSTCLPAGSITASTSSLLIMTQQSIDTSCVCGIPVTLGKPGVLRWQATLNAETSRIQRLL